MRHEDQPPQRKREAVRPIRSPLMQSWMNAPPHADTGREDERTKARDDGLNRRPAPGYCSESSPLPQPSVGLRPVGQPFALGVAMAGDRVEEGPRVCGAIDHASEAPIGFALAVERDAPAREHLWRSTG